MFLDTSGLLAYLHEDEADHAEAVRLVLESPIRIVHNYVLSELVPLTRSRGAPPGLVLDFLEELQAGQLDIETVFVGAELHAAGVNLLRRRPDKQWSLCDAISFILMQRRGLTEALTTDHHFEQAGFRRLLRP